MPALGKLNKQYLSVYNNKYTGDELFIIGDSVKGKQGPAVEITLGDNTKDWIYTEHLEFIQTALKYEEEIILPLTEQEKGLRYNENKLKWSLVHFKSLEPMVKVLMFGAKKYSPDNWKKGLDKKEILDSMMRHIAELIDGYETDKESGLPIIGHIQCNAMFYQFMCEKEKKVITQEDFDRFLEQANNLP